jgi:hypothetical protein
MLITYSYSFVDKMDGKYVVDIMFQSIVGLQFIIALQKIGAEERNILFMVQKKHHKYHAYAQGGKNIIISI